jgi:hypothetical protein
VPGHQFGGGIRERRHRGGPDKIAIDIIVIVDQVIPHTDDPSPSDVCMGVSQLARQPSNGFAKQREQVKDGKLLEFIALEVFARPVTRKTDDSAREVDDVE